ncbi:Gfo/Idh/MocA family protein [Maribacter aestuarii]|uniref:Gfo/Idh/MocA family protein n=1 Tax=Maribacter aestuarii TaxID=1130723 RepID=UPI0025A613FD|nr:Gfo/Idh/MocA family oxidoreductase [Maribacter aestuarii]
MKRRDFNQLLSKGLIGSGLIGPIAFAKTGSATGLEKKLGIALVGLGSYSTYQLAPALMDTEHCYLAGIVTGTKEKEKIWKEKYSIPERNIYNYENFDTIADNDDIDIVYVVLPNSMHSDFSIRAAKAGKHVICEKPMAVSVAECDAIIDACEKAKVKLSVGYRMQSDPYTNEVKKHIREKTFGEPLFVSSDAGYISRGNPNQWRLNQDLSGGGALVNMGVYSIQTSIYGTGSNPISVSAQEFSTRPEYFKDTDETITAQFEFPNGAAGHMFTSHNANGNRLKVHCSDGWFELDPAHSYGPISGRTSKGNVISFPHRSQQALQMDDFAKHILTGSTNVAPGAMGKRDMIIVEAIYKSIKKDGAKQILDLGTMGIVT